MRLALAGATGNVGREIIRLLEESTKIDLNIKPIFLASTVSEGEGVPFADADILVQSLKDFTFENIDVIIFATPSEVSKAYIPKALEKKVQVIDLSSAYRSDEGVPMIVDAVNGSKVTKEMEHVSLADVATVQLATIIQPLLKIATLKRVDTTCMYPTSRNGKMAMDELFAQSAGLLGGAGGDGMEGEAFQAQVAFNVVPQVGEFTGNNSEAEIGLLLELNRVLETPVPVISTAVYVPTFIGMSQSVTLDFNGTIKAAEVRKILEGLEGVSVIDNPEKGEFSTPYGTAETSQIFISRIRDNALTPGSLQFWVTCDNLRTGAALQVTKILERLL
ncbi:MAG: aspartate-semialdehyde dehydrogenase [Alphaproteobacteria bacterium]|jgi:aspartate-semialdehyde dehydrogenase